MEEREPERATAQSTAVYEDKDDMSSGTGNAQWDDVETRHEGCEQENGHKVAPIRIE